MTDQPGETKETPPGGAQDTASLLNGRYKLIRPLGQGGMGTVYLAEHVRLDTIVAVKEVHAESNSPEDYAAALAQCEREARTLVKLNHPNLPNVTDAFIEADRFYLVMEYIDGVTLETRLKEAGGKPLDPATVVEWGLQVADVLAYLHAQEPPIIFRDLKPANIMAQPNGNVRLIDFGIARRFQPGASKDTALLGSVGYSPPEQFGRHQTDTRSDIYALGATLHHLLTGHDPAASPFKFKPAREINPAVPSALSDLIAHCVMLDTETRPQDVHSVAMRLLGIRDELASGIPEPDFYEFSPDGANGVIAPGLPARSGSSASLSPGGAQSPSGSTGPRIISTKLAEAEAQKRRTGSRDIPTALSPPSGRMSAPGTGNVPSGGAGSGVIPSALGAASTPAAASTSPSLPSERPVVAAPIPPMRRPTWLVPALTGGLVALIFVGALLARAHHASTMPAPLPIAKTGGTTSVLQPTTSTTGTKPDNNTSAPSLNSGGGEMPPPTSDRQAEVKADAQGVDLDAQGSPLLRIAATGKLIGSPSDSATLAAFFYNGDDQSLPASDPQSVYANREGQASVAHSLTPNADGTFSTQMTIPLSVFRPEALNAQMKFRCVVFLNNQRAGETDMTLLPFPLPVPNSGGGARTGDTPANGTNRGGQTPRGIGGFTPGR